MEALVERRRCEMGRQSLLDAEVSFLTGSDPLRKVADSGAGEYVGGQSSDNVRANIGVDS
jgi:hypothetical protein